MTKLRKRTEEIRQFIMENVGQYPKDINNLTARRFDITRQAVNKHIQSLVEQKTLALSSTTHSRLYVLQPIEQWVKSYVLSKALEEHVVWENDISPRLGEIPENILDIWQHGFTEMLNNAIDHSSGKNVKIFLTRTAIATQIVISDDGEGIFKKIQREMGLMDERHAVLELAKGKLTTDPKHHSGEGIFFSSQMFDDFSIHSGSVVFNHKHDKVENWIFEMEKSQSGTMVFMKLNNNVTRTSKEVFDKYAGDEDFCFTKTVVPVRLAQYGHEKLISRSQAKRVLVRIDRFKIVIFDFKGVDMIGQAFADEIFRVFSKQYPDIELLHVNMSKEVEQMISRAKSRTD